LDKAGTIGDARKLMDFNNIDRLPIVDEDNRFIGMVLQIDLLRRFYMRPDTGGKRDLRSGIQTVMSFPVKGVMREIGKRIRVTDKISDALILMLSENLRGLVILNHEDKPAGLLLRRDILSLLAEEGREGFVINLSGAKLQDFENQKIISLVSDKMNKIYRMAPRIREVKIHLKEVHGSEESEGKYEVNLSIIGPRKPIQTEAVGFDPFLVIDDLLDNVERILKE
jgi:CBS domain-containing protein